MWSYYCLYKGVVCIWWFSNLGSFWSGICFFYLESCARICLRNGHLLTVHAFPLRPFPVVSLTNVSSLWNNCFLLGNNSPWWLSTLYLLLKFMHHQVKFEFLSWSRISRFILDISTVFSQSNLSMYYPHLRIWLAGVLLNLFSAVL